MRRGMLLAMALGTLTGWWGVAGAQAPLAAATAADTAAPADSALADTTHHKKGLFGKAKGVMKNKVVRQVVKTAACTMVPGGQAIAGAIDAASSNSAAEAASGAAGAATGAGCMPGMGLAGTPAPGLAGGMAAGGIGGGSMAVAGLAGGAAGMGAGAAGYAPGMAPMPASGLAGDPQRMADCLGITVEEYQAMIDPTGGEARPMTKDEMKRVQKLGRKMNAQRQVECVQRMMTP